MCQAPHGLFHKQRMKLVYFYLDKQGMTFVYFYFDKQRMTFVYFSCPLNLNSLLGRELFSWSKK